MVTERDFFYKLCLNSNGAQVKFLKPVLDS